MSNCVNTGDSTPSGRHYDKMCPVVKSLNILYSDMKRFSKYDQQKLLIIILKSVPVI